MNLVKLINRTNWKDRNTEFCVGGSDDLLLVSWDCSTLRVEWTIG